MAQHAEDPGTSKDGGHYANTDRQVFQQVAFRFRTLCVCVHSGAKSTLNGSMWNQDMSLSAQKQQASKTKKI